MLEVDFGLVEGDVLTVDGDGSTELPQALNRSVGVTRFIIQIAGEDGFIEIGVDGDANGLVTRLPSSCLSMVARTVSSKSRLMEARTVSPETPMPFWVRSARAAAARRMVPSSLSI